MAEIHGDSARFGCRKRLPAKEIHKKDFAVFERSHYGNILHSALTDCYAISKETECSDCICEKLAAGKSDSGKFCLAAVKRLPIPVPLYLIANLEIISALETLE